LPWFHSTWDNLSTPCCVVRGTLVVDRSSLREPLVMRLKAPHLRVHLVIVVEARGVHAANGLAARHAPLNEEGVSEVAFTSVVQLTR